MLATFNLQLLSFDALDDSSLSPVSLAPGDGQEIAVDFADLLRLRVDAPLLGPEAGGELLPPGGSALPILTDLDASESLPDLPAIDPDLVKLAPELPELGRGPGILAEEAALALDTQVLYPAGNDAGLNPELPILSPQLIQGLPGSNGTLERSIGGEQRADGLPGSALDPRLAVDNRRGGRPAAPVPVPVIDGREARAQAASVEAGAPTPASLGLRDRGQPGESTTRTAPVVLANTFGSAPNGAPEPNLTADPTRQIGLMPLQRSDNRPAAGSEVLKTRLTASPISSTPQTAINPQPTPPSLAATPAAAAPVDLSYAAAGQQSTDLIGTSVRDAAWGDRIGDRVVMMASSQLKQAEIRLTPAELGPLRVQVSVDDGAAHVTFHAQHAVTREALEQAMPRLRELLAENGLSLGQADVSDRGVGEGGRESGSDGTASESHLDGLEDLDVGVGQEAPRRPTTSNGLVDTFV